MNAAAPVAVEWRVCPTCPPDENEWDASAFTLDARRECCNDCTLRLRRKLRVVRVRCASRDCQAIVQTTANVEHPMCRRCRARLRLLLHYTRLRVRAAEGPSRSVRKPCSGCGRRMQTTERSPHPTCYRCRANVRGATLTLQAAA